MWKVDITKYNYFILLYLVVNQFNFLNNSHIFYAIKKRKKSGTQY